MKLKIILASIIALILSQKVIAGVYDAPHKWNDPKSGRTIVYIPGTPGQSLDITREKTQIEKIIVTNSCGFGRLGKGGSTPISWIVVQGFSSSFEERSQSSVNPTCKKNSDGSYTSSWEALPGKMLETPTSFFIWSGTPNTEMILLLTQSVPLTKKVNPCGLLVTSRIAGKFKIGSTEYDTESLPTVSDPIICWKKESGHMRYTPDPLN